MTTEELAKQVIEQLDTIARNVCSYDYGLPTYNDEAMPEMMAVVVEAIRKATEPPPLEWPMWGNLQHKEKP